MSKTEVSGKQIKDGSIELADLSAAVASDINTLKSDVSTLQTDVATKADAGNLATVATSGSYTDLSNKPTIPSVAGLASETYVDTAVAGVVNSAPAVLDTLNELSAALGNDENFATTVAGQIGDVAADVSALDGRVTSVEADVASLQGASAPNLSDLGEVAITTPSSGQVLKYNGTGWANAADNSFSGAYADLTGKPTLFDGAYSSLTGTPSIPANLDDLSDVTLTSPSNGQVLSYNGTAWVNSAAASGGASDLDGLSDVAITSAAKGHFLAHNGTSFVNTRTIEADVAATVPLTVKGAASQSSNLFNITDSANSNLVAVTSAGSAYFNGGGWNSAPVVITGEIGNNPAFNIRGVVAGGSGNYGLLRIMGSGTGIIDFETSNSAGGSWNGRILGGAGLITIGTSSGASRGYPAWFGGWDATYPSLSLVALNAAAKGLVVKGAASQTGHLLELQNSAGTWQTRLTSTGLLRFNYAASTVPIMVSNQWDEVMFQVAIGANSATSNSTIRLGTQVYQFSEFGWNGTNSCFHIWGRNNRVFSMQSPDDGAGVYTFDIARNTGTGAWEINSGNRSFNMKTSTTGGVGINTAPGGSFHTLSTSASRKGMIVQGAASQTANLFEAQNSAGTSLVTIDSSGKIGVATTPIMMLDVQSAGEFTVGGGNFKAVAQFQKSSGNRPGVICGYDNSGNGAAIIGAAANLTGTPIAFWTYNNTAWGERARIAESGYLGINTTAPTAHVHVNGDCHAKRYTETVANAFNTSLAPSSGTLTVDTSTGNAVLGALSAAVTTWAFTNAPTDNSKVTTVTAVLAGNASYTYGDACSVNGSAVSGGIMWSGGSAPTATAGTDIITFIIVKDSAGTVKVFGSATTNFS